MIENIKVSIIIPVYNMEQYLRQCLNSIANQTLKDIEIICIDDCSTDSSLSILNEYAKKDARFVVVKQEFNQGQGAARNKGIELARGEYIGFVDPDDWLDLSMYEKMYNQAKSLNSQIVMCRLVRYHEEEDTYEETYPIMNADDNLKIIYPDLPVKQNLDKNYIDNLVLVSPHFCWNKIYEKKLLMDNNITFSQHRSYQDVPFVLLAMLNAKSISYTDDILYYYRWHLYSTTKNKQSCRANIFIEICYYLKKLLMSKGLLKYMKNFEVFVVKYSKGSDKARIKFVRKNLYNRLKKLISPKYRNILQKRLYSVLVPKISIIIPVYNAEKYLEKCLDSVKQQTLGHIQVICVNDFSTDNSQAIIEKYLYDKRFKLVNLKKNRGPGYARNKGLEKAKGDYIMFLDPDDWLEKSACEAAYNQIVKNNNDYVVFGYNEYCEDTGKSKVDTYRIEPFNALLDNPHISYKDLDKDFWRTSFAWAQIYKRSFLEENEICFSKNYLSEDVPFYAKLVANTNDISVINEPLYNYRRRNTSLSFDGSRWDEIIKTRKKAYQIILSSPYKDDLLDTFLIFAIKSSIYWYEKFSEQDGSLAEIMYDQVRSLFTHYKIEHKENIKQIKKYIPYNKFKKIIKFNYKQYKFFNIQNIFSIKNTKNHKVLTVCWAKIKFKRNR